MVHEPRWELHSNLGRHETYILKTIPRLLQSQGGYIWNNPGRRIKFGKLCRMLSIQPSEIKIKTLREKYFKKTITQRHKSEYIEILNLMGTCDVSQLSYDNFCELCRR